MDKQSLKQIARRAVRQAKTQWTAAAPTKDERAVIANAWAAMAKEIREAIRDARRYEAPTNFDGADRRGSFPFEYDIDNAYSHFYDTLRTNDVNTDWVDENWGDLHPNFNRAERLVDFTPNDADSYWKYVDAWGQWADIVDGIAKDILNSSARSVRQITARKSVPAYDNLDDQQKARLARYYRGLARDLEKARQDYPAFMAFSRLEDATWDAFVDFQDAVAGEEWGRRWPALNEVDPDRFDIETPSFDTPTSQAEYKEVLAYYEKYEAALLDAASELTGATRTYQRSN